MLFIRHTRVGLRERTQGLQGRDAEKEEEIGNKGGRENKKYRRVYE